MSQGRSSEPLAQAVQDAGSVTAACRRVGEELGINTDTLRGRAKQAQIAGQRPGPVLPMARGSGSWSGRPQNISALQA
jgi:hypothetical protein